MRRAASTAAVAAAAAGDSSGAASASAAAAGGRGKRRRVSGGSSGSASADKDKDGKDELSAVFLTSPQTQATTRAPKVALQGACRSVQEFEKLDRIGEGTYGVV